MKNIILFMTSMMFLLIFSLASCGNNKSLDPTSVYNDLEGRIFLFDHVEKMETNGEPEGNEGISATYEVFQGMKITFRDNKVVISHEGKFQTDTEYLFEMKND